MIAVKTKRPRFFQLTKTEAQFLLGLNATLTAAEWRMWLYLVTLDPFGDVGAKFDAKELMHFCNIQKSTYFAAKAKFIKLGLFEFVEGTTKVRNLKGSKADRHSEVSGSNSEISNRCSEISEQQTPEPKPVIDPVIPHTFSNIISDSFTETTQHTESEEMKNLDPDREHQDEDLYQLTIDHQKNIPTNSLLPKETGEDSSQVPPPPAATEISFLEWVKRTKAQDARHPQIYAETCIKRDDGSLRAEYERWLASRKDPIFSLYKPEPIVVPPPEKRASAIAKAKEFLRSRGLKL